MKIDLEMKQKRKDALNQLISAIITAKVRTIEYVVLKKVHPNDNVVETNGLEINPNR